jgi:GT2 family glycosyltransferase
VADVDVSVVVVAYNSRASILDCLAALDRHRGEVGFDVVVVDNASQDGTAEAIEQAFPDVRLCRITENVGFGRAVNRAATEISTDYLLLLNPDAEAVGPVVDELVHFARNHPGHGLYAGRTLRPDGTDDGYSIWGLPSIWSMVTFATGLSAALPRAAWANPEGLPRRDRARPGEVPAVSGCVLLIERAAFERLGGFDPRYFLYSEDIDLSRRAARAGLRPMLCPTAKVIHQVGASSSPVRQRVMLLRGKATYLRQQWPSWLAWLGLRLLVAGIALRTGMAVLHPRSASADWRAVWRERRVWTDGWPPVFDVRPSPVG